MEAREGGGVAEGEGVGDGAGVTCCEAMPFFVQVTPPSVLATTMPLLPTAQTVLVLGTA